MLFSKSVYSVIIPPRLRACEAMATHFLNNMCNFCFSHISAFAASSAARWRRRPASTFTWAGDAGAPAPDPTAGAGRGDGSRGWWGDEPRGGSCAPSGAPAPDPTAGAGRGDGPRGGSCAPSGALGLSANSDTGLVERVTRLA